MFVVTVIFDVKDEYVDKFIEHSFSQAKASLAMEKGCHQFDISVNSLRENSFLLYEVYQDKAMFECHLKSNHYLVYDNAIRDWINSKEVMSWKKVE
ncbi:putative quinol monooxygenase [Sediminispirochaeta smaragdinae]|jgi:quinol monooxygenase YgiN|uniref:Antibiotic biosynthesis monooxygenase n=1 Tax=Sediminispirochaeta smaragdinae (strain DSM 11293 / JCM 15392 / SEBR 4228) TaxID=573413 RepID=E1RAK9_SEDSS|nr:antibiotic biosynthesis monooxygenase [Sediminispirochaeta smaragdinae]ADK82377.1 Antibiotic biosynthesis monooxygenase [Sediminispirochaeta smaragdinae DSM 11293]